LYIFQKHITIQKLKRFALLLCWDGRKLKFESTLNAKVGIASNDGMMFKPLYMKIHRIAPNVWRKERQTQL
jgi:hypothetical protein